MKKNHIIILLAVLALSAGIALQNRHHAPEQNLSPFSLPDVSGKQHLSSEWQGKTLVINFWATWCPSCLEEIPQFIAWQEQYRAKGVQFIGIAVDKQEAVADYMQRVKINYPILIATNTGLNQARLLGNSLDAIPFTVIVNPQGKIVYQGVGEFSKARVEDALAP